MDKWSCILLKSSNWILPRQDVNGGTVNMA